MTNKLLGKRDIPLMTYEEIRAHLWRDACVSQPIGLCDRFTVDALHAMCEHEDFHTWPEHFRNWVYMTIQDVYDQENLL